jgi:predicted CopG family antitoxin
MSSKTISLEVDAYERLKAARLKHESFSEAVRRLVPPPPGRAADLLARAKDSRWGKSLDWNRIEEAYRSRRRRPRD